MVASLSMLSVYQCFPGEPSDQISDLFGPDLDAGEKPGCSEKTCKSKWN